MCRPIIYLDSLSVPWHLSYDSYPGWQYARTWVTPAQLRARLDPRQDLRGNLDTSSNLQDFCAWHRKVITMITSRAYALLSILTHSITRAYNPGTER